jgi:precorrin-2 dehydrogenase/sirohydrochlorin ferrochelatase
MGWTPLFLEAAGKKVLIAGAGEVGTRRAKRFLEAGCQLVIIGSNMPPNLKEMGASLKPLNEAPKWVEWAELVVVASSDPDLNEFIAHLAEGKLLNRADYPDKGNIIVPSSFFIGDVQISIFTGGKSPLMAKELRKKIQNVIKKEDVLQLELQNFTRRLLKDKVEDQKKRRSYLYQILNDRTVKKLLEEGKLEDAKEYVEDFLNNS